MSSADLGDKRVAIIGGGPAGLMAAETIAASGAAVTVFDRMPSVGRKFLMAGRGGLNLTHSEPIEGFVQRYGAASDWMKHLLDTFPPQALIAWAEGLGQSTFIGTSGRVFPRAMKASPLLRAWLRRLDEQNVRIVTRAFWTGWDDTGALTFADGTHVQADATILALGGASWPRLGADGAWTERLPETTISPLRPANCGFTVTWSDIFRTRFAGAPLKRIALTHGADTVRGEAVITAEGIEGGVVYALSARLRDTIERDGTATLTIDLRPDVTLGELTQRLATRGKDSLSSFLRKRANLPPVAVGLVQEALHQGADIPLATLIKAVPIKLTATFGLERAISTAGGVSLDEIDARLMLRHRPGIFVAGEMLDWEAPTGGYLLQGCMASGMAAGRGVLDWLHEVEHAQQ